MISGSITGTAWFANSRLVVTIAWPGQVTVGITPNRMTSDPWTGACGKDRREFVSPYQVGFRSLIADRGSPCHLRAHSHFVITHAGVHILQILSVGLHTLLGT